MVGGAEIEGAAVARAFDRSVVLGVADSCDVGLCPTSVAQLVVSSRATAHAKQALLLPEGRFIGAD
jgi:hypothetical protein